MQRRRVISSFGSALGSLALGGWSRLARAQSAGVDDNRVVLGQSAASSGPASQLGLQFRLGAQLHFDAVNAKGGINGRLIEMQRLDDGDDPERCAANTRQFIQANVFALFGYAGTATSLAALPLASAAKVPLFAPISGAQALREPFSRYAIHVRASYSDETALIVRHATSLGIRKIAVFHQNDAYGKSGLDGIGRALQAQSLAPVAVGMVERNSMEVAAALASILASKPEAIVQIGVYKACATFIRLARQQGYAGSFYNLSSVGAQALSDELGTVAKGVAVSQVMPFPYAAVTPLSRDYLAALKDLRGVAPNYVGMEGFVAARVFTEALARAGRNLTRETFINAVGSLQNLNLGGFPLDFGPNKNMGSNFVELTLLTEDGRVRR